MLRKYDPLEVVFDPGTDKVEKRCLGPASALCGDAGCRTTQPGKNTQAEPIYSIEAAVLSQFRGMGSIRSSNIRRRVTPPGWRCIRFRHELIPIGKCPWGRNSERGGGNYAGDGMQIRQRINLFAPAQAENGPAHKK